MIYPYIKLWAGMMRLMTCYELALSRSLFFFLFFPLFYSGGSWGIQRDSSLERSFLGAFSNWFLLHMSFTFSSGVLACYHT